MMKRIRLSLPEYMKLRTEQRNVDRREAELSLEHIKKIAKHPSSKLVLYAAYKKSYDYVNQLFPDAEVKEATVYKVNADYLERLGYKGIGGFYNRIAQTIVIPHCLRYKQKKNKLWDSIKIKATFDEILVHELLHYVSSMQLKGMQTLEIEEEFAYGYSVNFLRQKGSSKDRLPLNLEEAVRWVKNLGGKSE